MDYGFFDNLKEKEKIRKEKIKEQAIIDYNVFEGIDASVIFPDTELRIKQHSGGTRALATFGLGIIGFAAASGTKQEEQNRTAENTLQVVEKGIVFKRATSKVTDLRIPWDNIISSKKVMSENKVGVEIPKLFIMLLENCELLVSFILPKDTLDNSIMIIRLTLAEHISNIINERACGVDEAGCGLENEVEQIETEQPEQLESKSFSEADELDKWFSLYERGVISKEEYDAKKKQLLGL